MKHFIMFLPVLAVLVMACTREKETTGGTAGELSVNHKTFWILGHWYGEGKKELLVRETVREFALLNQELEITLGFNQLIYKGLEPAQLYYRETDSIASMVKSDIWPWDILFIDRVRYARVAELLKDPEWGAKVFIDFSDSTWFVAAHRDGLFQSADYKSMYGGILPGPLLEGVSYIMFVSGAVEKKLGIQVKSLDMTASDFTKYAKAVSDYNSTHTEKITFFSNQLTTANDYLFRQLVLSSYGNTLPGNRTEALKALKSAYQVMEEISVYKPVEQYLNYSSIRDELNATRTLYENNCLFNIQPTWIYLLWTNTNPDGAKQMRPCEIPSLDQGLSPFYAGFCQVIFVVPKNAANAEAGARFIRYISSREIAEKWINYSKCPTGLKSGFSATDFGKDQFDIFFQHINKKYGSKQVDVDISAYLFGSKTTIDFKPAKVLDGTLSASDALRNVLKQL
jgi:hypothetical protein